MRKNKFFRIIITLVVVVACMIQTTCSAFAASAGKTYVKEVILSYGKTEDAAKKWLTDKGYEYIDNNLNEGADDSHSTARAVYLGYKTTKDADEAITDMKLMNMTGGYSSMDYQLLLKQQRADIAVFISDFIVAVTEYRENYERHQSRAVAAHDMLNLLYDDDTEQEMGDLLLEKIKEEYTDKEFAALSKEEQAKHADMTTILMQSNSKSVLLIEQLIAIATDTTDGVWTDRYAAQPTYDEMVDELMDEENLTLTQAMSKLASMYDSDAELIASKIDAYKEYLTTYTEADATLEDSESELEAYREAEGDVNTTAWIAAGAQYKALESLKNADGDSLLDILTGDDYDVANNSENRYLLYPMVASLTEGQRACLDFLPLYQIVAIGINGDDPTQIAMDALNLEDGDLGTTSIYDGVDRAVFSDDVALTGNAYALQASSTKEISGDWFDNGISDVTKIFYLCFGVSVMSAMCAFTLSSIFNAAAEKTSREFVQNAEQYLLDNMTEEVYSDISIVEGVAEQVSEDLIQNVGDNIGENIVENIGENAANQANNLLNASLVSESNNSLLNMRDQAMVDVGNARTMGNVCRYIGIGLTVVSIGLMCVSLWNTYKELKAYYNTTLTAIPGYMVDEAVNANDEKVYTYYKAVLCNREEGQFTTDRTKILKAFGDINGDVGKEWVALYTTTSKSAGNPITTEFTVQYADTNIPGESTPLSIFCNSSAQNLTNYKNGFTYADKKGGIYLFYSTDSTAFAGSAITTGTYAVISGGCLIVIGLATYLIKIGVKKRKEKTNA